MRDDLEKTAANMKPKFDVAEHQQAFSDACAAFQAALVARGGSLAAGSFYCWIDDFAAWAPSNGYSFPVVPASDFRAAAVAWKESVTPSYT